jgi:hypothetical protein
MQAAPTPIYKTTKCKRCGSKTVAWQTSKKTGRYYLTEVFEYDEGEQRTTHTDFHSAYCELPERHDEKQAEIDALRAVEEHEQKQKQAERDSELRRREHTASDRVLGWYAMDLHQATLRMAECCQEITDLEREIEHEQKNPVSMDYLVDHIRYVENLKQLNEKRRWLVTERDVLAARLENENTNRKEIS